MRKWDLVKTTTEIYISKKTIIPKGTIAVYQRLTNGKYQIFLPEYSMDIYVEKNEITEEIKNL